MNNKLLSFIGWCLVCATVIFVFLPVLFVNSDNNKMNGDRQPSLMLSDWQVSFGSGRPADHAWKNLRDATDADFSDFDGTLWLRHKLPELNWRNSYLFFSLMYRFEVYLDEAPLYQFNTNQEHRHMNPNKSIHPVRIQSEDAGKTLLIRTDWGDMGWIGSELAMVGEPDQLLLEILQGELAFIVYSILCFAAGMIGLIMFVWRREGMYGWFTLFCMAIGGAFLFSCRSLQWFAEAQALYYWQELLTPAAIWAGIGFYANALGVGHKSLLKAAHGIMALYVASVVLMAATVPHLFRQEVVEVNTVMAIAAFILVTATLIHHRKGKGAREIMPIASEQRKIKQWLMRGYYTFMICELTNFIMYMTPNLLNRLFGTRIYFYKVVDGLLPNGLFLFIICMIMVMVSRVRHIHMEAERNAGELLVKNKELEQFHHNLEELVETRTTELERANRTLALSLREKAETLAEMSVLEERNRIAYEMHDLVGHTLTATIVQLEATKKLTEKDGKLPLDKLELLSELVRKGLDDIRKTVRLLKVDEEQPLSMEASLRELIQYTEDTMEIELDSQIALPSGLALGKMTEGVIYHALQEGLTNGMRHGGSRQFWFTLRHSGNALHFRLVNDGEPFGSAAPGFGLTSMKERVELLGGKVSIDTSVAGDGTPMGCELKIVLPV